ncbi:MAG: tandem-95 repeat protein [Candidatus Neomarinimicrobiota bacterium]|nr:tandem-95 repeat protein [Candidatus Neomarinimicrobiota bacterium]
MRIFSNSISILLVAYSFLFCKILAQTNLDDYDSPTQDWIFGDAPEPKWVTALLKGSHSIPEDTEFILSIPILESAVTYEAIVDSNASFEITNDHLIITPKEDFHGYIFVNLKLDMSFILKVNPVNDIPILAEIEPQSIEEDAELILNLFALDMDGDNLTYGATIDGNGIVNTEGDILTISPNQNYNGPINVSIAVSDGKDTEESGFNIQVLPVNDAPIIDSINSQSIIEDSSLRLLLSGTDVDGDTLTYSADAGENAKVNIDGNQLLIIPDNNFNGDIDVFVYVNDGNSKDKLKFVLTVVPVNDAPVLTSIIPYSKKEKITIQMLANDIDGDKLTYSAIIDGSAKVTVDDNFLTVKPNKDYKGTAPLTLKTFDGSSTIDTNITLINPIPGVLAIAPQSMKEDTELILKLTAKDIEGDRYIFKSKINKNSETEIINDKLIIKPMKDYFGKLKVSLTVSDNKDSTNFDFNINVSPVKDSPNAIAGDDLKISDGCNTSFTLDGTKSWDADNDELKFKWELLHQSKPIEFDTPIVKYTFSDSTIDRDFIFGLTVTDITGLSDYDTLLVSIINETPPIADAGFDFIAPIDKKVFLDGSGSNDTDSDIMYNWIIIDDDISLSKIESKKQTPYFFYPRNLMQDKTYAFVLYVKDNNSYCEKSDTVLVTCLKNVGIADDVKFELIRASKKDKKVFIDLDITNQQSWPLDFAALTLIRVKNEIDYLGQINPYKGKNTVKYGIENGETVGVELVYDFETSPSNITILCKPNIRILSDSVMYALNF